MALFDNIGETVVRLSAFIFIFLAMAGLETILPKRALSAAKSKRWFTNIAITIVNSLFVRALAQLAVPIAGVAAAVYCQTHSIGLFNWLDLPLWLEVVVTLLIFDFAVWLQHLIFHKWPLLWRMHQVHHADIDIDVTTAIRFHPIEIGISMLWKIAWVFATGANPLTVIIFEIILNGCAMFNHANVALPAWLDRIIRVAIVTPDMHRVHHSIDRREHDSNYGFNLSIWDRLFRTYCAQPSLGHQDMIIGLPRFQSEKPTRLGWSLALPFRQSRSED